MSSRVPTEKQARQLRVLADGAMALAPGRRDWTPLLRRGWVAPEMGDDGKRFLPPLRITPAGLRALADAQERDGLEPINGERRQLDEAPAVTRLKADLAEARQRAAREERRRCYAESRLRMLARSAVDAMEGLSLSEDSNKEGR